MAKEFTRNEIRDRFAAIVRDKKAIVITSAGIGIAAKFEEYGGSDMILITSSSCLRMDGHSSAAGLMPYGNANDIVVKTAGRISPVIKSVPMAAGVCGTDPTTEMTSHLETLKFIGFSAVINSPSVGVIDGRFRSELEYAGLGYEREIDMLKMASEMGFYAIATAFNEEQAKVAAAAGVDAIVCDMGFTVGGCQGALQSQAITLEQAAERIRKMSEIIRQEAPDVLLLAHGGPIATCEDAAYICNNTHVVGMAGGSAVERIPMEQPLTDAVKQFKDIEIIKIQ